MIQAKRDAQRKLTILKRAEEAGYVARTCRYFGVGGASFYRWNAAKHRYGDAALVRRKPTAKNPKNRTPPEVVEKIFHL